MPSTTPCANVWVDTTSWKALAAAQKSRINPAVAPIKVSSTAKIMTVTMASRIVRDASSARTYNAGFGITGRETSCCGCSGISRSWRPFYIPRNSTGFCQTPNCMVSSRRVSPPPAASRSSIPLLARYPRCYPARPRATVLRRRACASNQKQYREHHGSISSHHPLSVPVANARGQG